MSDTVNDVADKFIEIGESYILTKEEMDYLKQTAKDEMDYFNKIITNGNCCICGEPLDSGLFLCEKCAEHNIKRRLVGEWITGRLPDKPCVCLVTLYGDSICENYVDMAEFIAKPYHCKNAFLCDGEDITDEVLAWQPIPAPYQEEN